MTDKKKLVGIYLTLETLKRLKVYAASKLTSVSDVVEKAIKEFLDKKEKDPT